MAAISQAHICEYTFENIKDIIKTYVTDPNNRSGKWVFASFPEKDINSKADFPIIIVNDPTATEEPLSFGILRYTITVDIDIFSDKPHECDQVTDDIIEQIEAHYSTLSNANLKNRKIVDCRKDVISVGRTNIQVHAKTLVYEFEYEYTVS